MDIRRTVLFAALALAGLSLWNAWQADFPPPALSSSVDAEQATSPSSLVPKLTPDAKEAASVVTGHLAESTSAPIKVSTDVLDIAIDLTQGNIINSALLAYPQSVEEKNKPFVLLQNTPGEQYVANSNWFVMNGTTLQPIDFHFTAQQSNYTLATDENQLQVVLEGENEAGLRVKKEFTFTRGSYLIKVNYSIINEGSSSWTGYLNTQLLRSSPTEDKSSMFHVGSFTGASYSNPGKTRYQKLSFADMAKNKLNLDVKNGWVAMQQHYFLTAWVPDEGSENKFYTLSSNNDFIIGIVSQPLTVQPQEEKTLGSRLYVGPESTDVLKSIAPHLDLTVDYGVLWFVSSLLFSLMKTIYGLIGNWGWSIVLVTVLIKLAFYRLSATSYKSMAGMRKLQPKLQSLRERYGDDKAKMSQATMELYKQEKVNPLGGCLPILIQIPVFIALYWVLLESVELRQAPFILWIKDLASPDPYHVLPLIMGATMLIQQKLNPAPPDPVQAKVMMFLPVLFTGLFWNFPSGLVLYWIVNNTLSIAQQWYITRKYADDKPVKKNVAVTK
ncbi:MAG: membrane protein insertase YidC [Legionella sp.]|nr:MAG: membrane protein insertase YidC [Legionella sp.]PJD97131.1 MAG: membrane protein insertase YidC [Legionella sp.]